MCACVRRALVCICVSPCDTSMFQNTYLYRYTHKVLTVGPDKEMTGTIGTAGLLMVNCPVVASETEFLVRRPADALNVSFAPGTIVAP
jgi:hypothetical protein